MEVENKGKREHADALVPGQEFLVAGRERLQLSGLRVADLDVGADVGVAVEGHRLFELVEGGARLVQLVVADRDEVDGLLLLEDFKVAVALGVRGVV